MLRRLALSLAALAWLVPAQVFALGLGNIEMRSALNQPLDAHIELLRARQGELKDLTITLASADTFKRAGMERPGFLTQLQFEVVTNPGGSPYIQVKSVQPITEPFLNFLIEVNWPNGRLLREFTVLVDPPVVADRSPGAVEAPVVGQTPEGALVDQLVAEALGKAPPTATGAIEIPVPPQRTKTAAAVEPAAPITMPAAPDVVPEVAAERAPIEIPVEVERAPERPKPTVRAERPKAPERPKAVEPEPEPEAAPAAVAEGGLEHNVKSRDTLWEIARDLRPSKDVSVPQMMIALLENNPEAFFDNNMNNLKQGSVLRLQDVAQATKVEKAEAARIADLQWEQWKESRGTLVGSTPARTGRAPATPEATEARVKLVSPDAEGEEPGSGAPKAASVGGGRDAARLKKELSLAEESLAAQRLETQDMRERVTALEEQLTTMQRLIQLKDDQLAALQAQASKVTTPDAAGATPAVTAETPAAAKAGNAATPETAPTSKPAGLIAGLMNDPKLIGLAAVLGGIVVLLVWLVVRRRKMKQFQESILTLNESVSEHSFAQNKPESEDASFMSDFAVSSMEGIQTEVSEVDPLSEADVYLAYGRYKQAEELINQAIEKSPERAELKMKLMEIHYAAKDAEAFGLQAEMVRDTFTAQHPEMWARVLEMGRELSPDSPLFGGEGGGTVTARATDPADEFDLGDLNFDDDLGGASPAAGAAKTATADQALDFDLGDLKLHGEGGAKAAASSAEEHSLDFDLSAIDDIKTSSSREAPATKPVAAEGGLDFDFSSFGKDEEPKAKPAPVAQAAADDNGLDFDFGAGGATPSPAGGRDDNVVDFNFSATPGVAAGELLDQPSSDVALAEVGIDGELDDALFADVDEVGTKLDLAKAYIDMGDSEGARSILDEVMEEGNDNQKQEAQVLIRQIG